MPDSPDSLDESDDDGGVGAAKFLVTEEAAFQELWFHLPLDPSSEEDEEEEDNDEDENEEDDEDDVDEGYEESVAEVVEEEAEPPAEVVEMGDFF